MVLGSRFTEKQLTKVVFQEELVFLFYCSTESVNETNIYGSNFWISCYQSRVITIFAHNYPKDYPEPEVLIHLKRKTSH